MPSPDMARFLYTIIKQLDLKSVDWALVAQEIGVTNGHASRMRYSRFKQQMEGHVPTKRTRNLANKQPRKTKKAKDEDSDDVKVKLEPTSINSDAAIPEQYSLSSPVPSNTEAPRASAVSMTPESPAQLKIKAEPVEETSMPAPPQLSDYAPDLTDMSGMEYCQHNSPDTSMPMEMLQLHDQQSGHITRDLSQHDINNYSDVHRQNQVQMQTPSMPSYSLPDLSHGGQLSLQQQPNLYPTMHGMGHGAEIGMREMVSPPQVFHFPGFYVQSMEMATGGDMSGNSHTNMHGSPIVVGSNLSTSMAIKMEDSWDGSYPHV